MQPTSQRDLLLIAAARLSVGSGRLRLLARGDDEPLREWVLGVSSRPVAHARSEAKQILTALATFGARIVAIGDDDYPAGLRDLADAPAFLCVRGTLPLRGIAIIGSRTPPPQAESFAHDFARKAGEPVISGLALGIDAAAHHGALEAGTPTLAYVGNGFGETYPREHASLEQSIIGAGGAIATERFPHEHVTRFALVKRDRLQAAHARAVVLAASEAEGGAMQTLQQARALGRPCFVLTPPRSGAQGAPAWGGNVRALAAGAFAIPGDVDEALRILHAHRNIH